VVEEAGHLVEFYPKYHCETNFIERVWGEAKAIVRKNCLFNFNMMKIQVPQVLKAINISHIRAYHRRAWRYIDAYGKGLDGRVADWAVKKYRSHRKVSANVDQMIEEMSKAEKEERKKD